MTTNSISWTTDEKLRCLNCETTYNLTLTGTAVAVEEGPCPGCGSSTTNTWADEANGEVSNKDDDGQCLCDLCCPEGHCACAECDEPCDCADNE